MFTMAPAADQNPRYDAAYIKTDENGNKRTVDYGASSYVVVDLQGRQLANAVLTVCESNLGEQETEEVVTVAETIMVPGKEKKEGPGQKWPKSSAEYVPAEPVPLPLALTAIGTLVIVSIGCEVSSGNAARIREIMNENGFSNCVIVTQCNGSSSYMSDPHGYHVVTFSAKASHMMPEAVDFLMTGLEMLIQKL
jgi:hypothetical protein